MSDPGGGVARYTIEVDPSDVERLGDAVASGLNDLVSKTSKSVRGLDHAVAAAGKGLTASGQKLGRNIAQGTAQGIKANSALVQQALVQAQTQAVRGQQQAAAAAARQVLAQQTAAARLANTQAAAAGKANAAIVQGQAQQAVIAARTTGAQRVAITRFTLDTIGRLEKGLGRVIEGTASTIVAATRRIFAGTVGSLQRSFAERRSTITRNLNIEKGLFAGAAVAQQRASRGLLGAGLGAAGILGGSALAIAGIRQVFTLGSDFARGLNVLQAQLQLTDAQMKAVSDQSIQLGNDISLPGVSALDAASAINLLAKQFASLGAGALQAAQDAAKGTLQLSRAVGAPAEEAAQAVGAAVNVFKADAKGAVAIADQLAAGLSQAAGTSFSDFNLAFTQGAAVVSNFLVPAEGATNAITEFTSAIAILARGGVIGSDAGTSLKQFFLQANRGTDDAVTAMKEITDRAGVAGTAFFDEAGKARTLFQTIQILRQGLEGLTDEQKQNTIQTLFGADAARSASILIGQGEAEFLKTAAAVQRQGAAAALAAAQNKGLAGALDAIKSQFETFGILIFQKVNKPLGNAGLAVARFVDNLANAGGVFAAVRAGLKGVAIALGGLLAFKAAGEILGFGRALLGVLGPLGIAAVILGAAFGFLAKRFGSFSEVLAAAGRLIDRIAPQVAKLRKTIFDFLANLAAKGTVLGRFSGFLQQIFTLLGEGKAAQAFDRLKAAAGALLENLAPIGRAFANLLKPLQALIAGDFARAFTGFKVVGQQIATALSDAIRAGLKVINPFVGIGLDFIAKFKAQFIGAGIGAVAGGIIGGPLGVVIGAGIGLAVTNAIIKLKDIIGRVDVGALFSKFLEGVRFVGQKLAQLLFDKKTLLAVAGVAAAAAAIAAQFVVGFVQGLISRLGDIRAAGAEIIKAIFDLPSVVKSIAALAILIRGTLTNQFKSAGVGKAIGAVLGKEISDSTAQAVDKGTLGSRLKSAFVAVGKGAGQALSVGVAAALSGSALGSATSGLDQALGLGSLLGSVAAGGAAFGPAGAAGAAGIGLVTLAMSSNAKAAQEAKDRMIGFRDAMIQTGSVAGGVATNIGKVFGAGGSFPTAIKGLLAQTSFSTEGFTAAINKGQGESFIKDISKQVLELTGSLPDAAAVAALLKQELKGVAAAAKEIKISKELEDTSHALTDVDQRAGRVVTTSKDVAKEMARAKDEAQKLFVAARAEKLKAELDAVKQKAQDIGDKAVEANRKLLDLLAPKQKATTPQQATDQAVLQIPSFATDVAGGIEKGVDSAVGGAQVREGLQRFGTEVVAPAFAAAVKASNPGAALAEALQAQTVAINQLEVPQAAKDALLAQLNEGFATASNPAVIPVGAEANLLEAQAAAAALHATAVAEAQAKGQIVLTSGADLVSAQNTGKTLQSTAAANGTKPIDIKARADIASASSAGKSVASTAISAAAGTVASGATNIGRNLVLGISAGITANASAAGRAAAAAVAGVVAAAKAAAGIKSPSTVFAGIGLDIMKGLVKGIKEGGSAAEQAVTDVVQAMIERTKGVGSGLRKGFADLFKSTFDELSVGGGANTAEAIGNLTGDLRGILEAVAGNASKLWEIAAKDAGARTMAERLLLGESFTSLRLGDEFGVANRAAITGAVDSIKAIGEALLEQGFSAQQAADMLVAYRNQLVATAVQAGLSQAEVEALVNSLGLSAAGLTTFVAKANELQQIVNSGGQQQAAAAPLPVGPNPTQQFITNNLYLPTGDPEANALAVVNRLALAVR